MNKKTKKKNKSHNEAADCYLLSKTGKFYLQWRGIWIVIEGQQVLPRLDVPPVTRTMKAPIPSATFVPGMMNGSKSPTPISLR